MAYDYKRLCNELLSYLYQCNWPDGKRFYALVERTRAALAESEPEKQMTEKLTPEHIKSFLAKYENLADAREFLLKAGLIDESGNLAPPYRA